MTYRLRRHSGDRAMGGDRLEDYAAGRHLRADPDFDVAEHRRTCAEEHTLAYLWVSHSSYLAGAAQGHRV